MLVPHHDRSSYSAINDRVDYSWPDGKRLAVHIGLNAGHFAFGTGMSHSVSTLLLVPDQRAFAGCEYGNRVGIWRVFELLHELGLPASHQVNTTIFDYCPEVLAPIKARGGEIIGHRRTNSERQGHLWEKDEASFLAEVAKRSPSAQARRYADGWVPGCHAAASPRTCSPGRTRRVKRKRSIMDIFALSRWRRHNGIDLRRCSALRFTASAGNAAKK
jgi:hypothetical protein